MTIRTTTIIALAALAALISAGCGNADSYASDDTVTSITTTTTSAVPVEVITQTEKATGTEQIGIGKVTTTSEDEAVTTSLSERTTTTAKTETSVSEADTTTITTSATKQTSAKITTASKVTTKATTKVTTKATSKATTKATTAKPKQTAEQILAPLPAYQQAIGRITLGTASTQDWETVRKYYLDYGQKLYPRYKQDSSLTCFIDPKTGKGTNDWHDAWDRNNPPVANAWLYTINMCELDPYTGEVCASPIENLLEDIDYVDRTMKRAIQQTLYMYNGSDPEFELVWYVQFGKPQDSTHQQMICIAMIR